MAEGHSPLHQFEIQYLTQWEPVAGFNINFSNSSLWMVLSLACVALFCTLGMRRAQLVPGRFQSMVELAYEFIARTIEENAGKEGLRYFPSIFTLFMFVLACNLLGLIPYSFTATSHIAVTFTLAMAVFLAITGLAIWKHGFHFFSLFAPSGVPKFVLPLIVVIELFAYLSRPVSLSVRLAANMTAGHTMLKVIGGFVVALGFMFGWLPFAFLIVLNGFELFVAVLQAYIFAVLTCVYLHDAIHLH
jgi:F-type H+-transporting ATPase subunit a